jgi:hypothetical protein
MTGYDFAAGAIAQCKYQTESNSLCTINSANAEDFGKLLRNRHARRDKRTTPIANKTANFVFCW